MKTEMLKIARISRENTSKVGASCFLLHLFVASASLLSPQQYPPQLSSSTPSKNRHHQQYWHHQQYRHHPNHQHPSFTYNIATIDLMGKVSWCHVFLLHCRLLPLQLYVCKLCVYMISTSNMSRTHTLAKICKNWSWNAILGEIHI